MDHQFASAFLREGMGDTFGGFPSRIVAEVPPLVVLHDPVVEIVVRHHVNGCDRHQALLSIGRKGSTCIWRRYSGGLSELFAHLAASVFNGSTMSHRMH
jgi:hypothetical protein